MRRLGVVNDELFEPLPTRSGIGCGAPVKNDLHDTDAVSHSGTVGHSGIWKAPKISVTSNGSTKLWQGLA